MLMGFLFTLGFFQSESAIAGLSSDPLTILVCGGLHVLLRAIISDSFGFKVYGPLKTTRYRLETCYLSFISYHLLLISWWHRCTSRNKVSGTCTPETNKVFHFICSTSLQNGR